MQFITLLVKYTWVLNFEGQKFPHLDLGHFYGQTLSRKIYKPIYDKQIQIFYLLHQNSWPPGGHQ